MRPRTRRPRAGWMLLAALALSVLTLDGQERFRKTPPMPDPLPTLRLPNIESARLANGLSLSVAYREGFRVLSLQLIVFAGESSSPRTRPGLASVTANMVPRGSVLMTAEDVEERVEALGGSMAVSSQLDYVVLSIQFLEDYLDAALELLSSLLLQPNFSDRELASVRLMMFYDLLEKEKDPAFIAQRQLMRDLCKNHPYRNAFYNKEDLKNIGLKDLADFFNAFYRPNNAHVILTGNINLRTAVRKVSHYLNTWQPSAAQRPAAPPLLPNTQPRVSFIEVPGASDCTIYMGNLVFPMTDTDYFPLLVYHQVIGGSLNSRLILNLRESKSYAYFAFSQMEHFAEFTVFFIRAKVMSDVPAPSVQEIQKELRTDLAERLPQEEVERAKSVLIGEFPQSIERLDGFSAKIAQLKALGLGADHWERYYENIMLVDSERVFNVVQRLPLLAPVIVVAGEKSLINELKTFDRVDVYDLKGTLRYSLTKELPR